MHEKRTSLPIDALKSQVIDFLLISSTFLGFAAYILALLTFENTNTSNIIELIPLLLMLILVYYRKKVGIRFKIFFILISLFVFIFVDLVYFGILTASKVLIVLIPFTAILVFDINKSIALFIFALVLFMLIGYFYITGKLVAPSRDSASLNIWLINILLIAIVSIIIFAVQNKYNISYQKLIMDLEQTNKDLIEHEQNYREIFNASVDAIIILNMQGKILEVNESMLKMYGYMPHEIVDADFSKLISEKENYTTKQAQKYIQYVISGIALQFDWLSKKKTGEFFWVNIATKKITLAGENAILAIARDINEQKEDAIQLDLYRKHLKELVNQRTKELKEANEELLGTNDLLAQQKEELEAALNELQITQEQLIQSEKMASLGILAAGVAHEINNPLNFIQGGLYGLENIFEDQLKDYKKQVAPLLNAINMGIRRAADIVSSLNDYSRKDNFNTEKCDMHQIIEDSLFMIYNKMKNKIEIEKEYSDIPYLLYGNKGQLHQVVINVLLNAIYAIKSKGIIHIKTELSEDKFKLSIKDNGTGISSENMAKVFDPFFTTREVGQGTGLGMSISLKIIEEHKGRIEYKSKLNEGTEVIITLPVNNV